MRSYSSNTLAYFQSRDGFNMHVLIWISARNRVSGATETIGFWTGEEDRDFFIGGVTRSYIALGPLMELLPVTMEKGLAVRMHRLSVAACSPEVLTALAVYDAAFAPVEAHRACYSVTTGALVAEPHLLTKGTLDHAPIPTPEIGGEAAVEASFSSAARSLTKPLTLTKSDDVQKARSNDRFRRYQVISGQVQVAWGEERST